MDKKIIYRILREGLMLAYKKHPDKYFDWYTREEFPRSEINKHPRWGKYEYDNNGNEIYYEDSDGYWSKWKYDNNGKLRYYENSYGFIKDNIDQIQEGLMLPYKKRNIKYFDWNTEKEFPYEEIDQHPEWYKEEYDTDENKIYYEDSDGDWKKWEYDKNKQVIYREDNDGWWGIWEYDANGWLVYYENRDGVIIDDRRNQINEGLMLPYKKYQNYLSGIATVLVNQDWDTRYDAAQQRENRFNIKKALVEIFKDPNVMVRVADLYEWSDGNNGFITFNNLNHYITDIGFKSFADDPMLFFDIDKLKQHILYVYASGASGNLRRGERYRDYKYNPNDDFEM